MNGWAGRFAFLLGILGAGFAPFALAESPSGRRAPARSAEPFGSALPPATSSSAAAPRAKGFTDAVSCSACHTTVAWKSQGSSGENATFDHSTTGFPLTGEHIHAACAACHNATRTIKRACVSCHEDFHRGRLSQSCDTCHSPAGWKVTQPLDIHRRSRFPLTGMHVLADCSECHVRASEQRWTDAPIDCFACHEKDYRRPNIFPVHVGTAMTAPLPRDCSVCHRALAWVPAIQPSSVTAALASPLQTAPAGHDMRFPISFGVHRIAACDDCHASRAAPRAVRCVGCHAHDLARLLQQHRRPMGTDGASCLVCHPAGVRR